MLANNLWSKLKYLLIISFVVSCIYFINYISADQFIFNKFMQCLREIELLKIKNNNSLVLSSAKDALKKSIKSLSNGKLGKLLNKSVEKNNEELQNIFASFIADRLPNSGFKINQLEVALRKRKFGFVKESALKYIKKHFFLKKLGKKEFTVADYFAANGLPEPGKILYLCSKSITSLYGLEKLLKPEEITEIYLNYNSILDPTVDTYPVKRIFKKFKSLKILDLTGNSLESISLDWFNDLSKLQKLLLGDNRINFISDRSLSGLFNLKIINLSHNKLSSLPINIFDKLTNLKLISVIRNKFRLTEQEFIEKYNINDNIELLFNPQNTLKPRYCIFKAY